MSSLFDQYEQATARAASSVPHPQPRESAPVSKTYTVDVTKRGLASLAI